MLATSADEYPDTDKWSSSRSTTTTGLMTPSEDESDSDDELASKYTEDRALEELLKAAKGEFTQKDLAKLVFHWTNVVVFREFERHALIDSL